MPEEITFSDENSSSTFEPQLLQCLPFVLEVNQQGKMIPLSITLNKPLYSPMLIKIICALKSKSLSAARCSQTQDSFSIPSCRDGSCKD